MMTMMKEELINKSSKVKMEVKDLIEDLKALIIIRELGQSQLSLRRDSYRKIMLFQRQDFIMHKKLIKEENSERSLYYIYSHRKQM